ncbi:MAG: succinyl-diaminopimelate desuccinylase [Actinomycetota bacterium]
MSTAERLAALTLSLVDIPSVSRDETAIVDHVRGLVTGLPSFDLIDDEDTCLLLLPAKRRTGAPLVLFAGHLDTVPIAGNVPGRREDGVVFGRGSSDQKAGVAVMLSLLQDIAEGSLATTVDAGFLFFGREEIDTSALAPCLARHPDLAREVGVAIVTEPTDNAVEVGCLGNLNARITVRGVAAHSARPWLGRNAIHGGVEALASIVDLPVRDVEIEGLIYREVINVTTIEGGVAANVIPDTLTATVNFRYAPHHSPREAEARIRELLGHRSIDVQIVSNAAGGPVAVKNPFVQRLRAIGDLPVRPKQAWTPVAEFGKAGIEAVNFGPGDPGYAHTDDERVTEVALVRSYELASALLREGP